MVENPGERVAKTFSKILEGGQCFLDKIARESLLFYVFLYFFNNVFENLLGDPFYTP
jgi:hypothetical protein